MTPAELRAHRQALGLTQEQLAHELGVTANTVARWERGVRQIASPVLVQLALQRLAYGSSGDARPTRLPAQEPDGPQGREPGPPHNLSRELTSFIGREQEIVEVCELLRARPLVTLTGAGGVGKTRLAVCLARTLMEDYTDGVWLADLAPLADMALVPRAVAWAVGVRERPGQDLVETLAACLRDRRLLLVLDNCEHVLTACAELADRLLRACPSLRILATSREPLSVPGETVWRVPSLSLPAPSTTPSVQRLLESEAVRLFVERAQAALPSFCVTEENARVVAELCTRLDGIPLALELAAVRLRTLTVHDLASRLDDSLRLLVAGGHTVPSRHQTLRGTLEWSYSLLSAPERQMLHRLAVFAGGWTLAGAEAVCATEDTDGLAVADLLGRLADKSLVVTEPGPDGGGRYWLLETVRQFARERLIASGEAATTRRRHAEYVLDVVEHAQHSAEGPAQAIWRQQLDHEFENVRTALRWTLETGQAETGLRIANALWIYWELHGVIAEGREWLLKLLALPMSFAHIVPRAKAFHSLSFLMIRQGDIAAARPVADEALAIVRKIGDRATLAGALNQAGRLATMQGDHAAGLPLLEEALRVSRAEGMRVLEVFVVLGFGYAAYFRGDHRLAWARFQEGWALARQAEDPYARGMALAALGLAATEQNHFAEAHRLFVASLEERQRVGNVGTVSFMLSCFAGLAAAKRQYERALRLEGAAEALRQASGSQAPDPYLCVVERRLARVRRVVGGDVATRAAAEGRALEVQQAIQLALADHADRRGLRSPAGQAGAHAALSPREQEVAALLALGLTNRQIAERLVITPRTAAAHVEHLLNKLDFSSRHQIGAWVAEQSERG